MMPITTLLLCRSIPAITFFIGRLSVELLLFRFTCERQLFYCEATASSTALNVYQSRGQSRVSPTQSRVVTSPHVVGRNSQRRHILTLQLPGSLRIYDRVPNALSLPGI